MTSVYISKYRGCFPMMFLLFVRHLTASQRCSFTKNYMFALFRMNKCVLLVFNLKRHTLIFRDDMCKNQVMNFHIRAFRTFLGDVRTLKLRSACHPITRKAFDSADVWSLICWSLHKNGSVVVWKKVCSCIALPISSVENRAIFIKM